MKAHACCTLKLAAASAASNAAASFLLAFASAALIALTSARFFAIASRSAAFFSRSRRAAFFSLSVSFGSPKTAFQSAGSAASVVSFSVASAASVTPAAAAAAAACVFLRRSAAAAAAAAFFAASSSSVASTFFVAFFAFFVSWTLTFAASSAAFAAASAASAAAFASSAAATFFAAFATVTAICFFASASRTLLGGPNRNVSAGISSNSPDGFFGAATFAGAGFAFSFFGGNPKVSRDMPNKPIWTVGGVTAGRNGATVRPCAEPRARRTRHASVGIIESRRCLSDEILVNLQVLTPAPADSPALMGGMSRYGTGTIDCEGDGM